MTSEPGTAPRRPTLDDVARRASVSTPTVSKVLNGHGDVAEATRSRVLEAVSELSYTRRPPRRLADRLVVEVMVDRLATPYGVAVLEAVVLAAEELDVDVQVSRFGRTGADGRRLSPRAWAARLRESGCAGAIVLTAALDPERAAALARAHIPAVAVDPLVRTTAGVPSVGSTSWAGGYAAAEHLLDLGHRDIAVVGGRPESRAAAARVHGVRAACAAAGVALDETLVAFVGFEHDAARATASAWFRDARRPTGIVTADDTQAMGVIEAARAAGLGVPEDLSVVGYDDTFLASWATPPLTTIRQPIAEIGRVALRTVLTLARGREPDATHVELATELVVRASTAPPRPGPPA